VAALKRLVWALEDILQDKTLRSGIGSRARFALDGIHDYDSGPVDSLDARLGPLECPAIVRSMAFFPFAGMGTAS